MIVLECFKRGDEGLRQIKLMVHDPDLNVDMYTSLLDNIGKAQGRDEAFKWLLDRADRQDLEDIRRAGSFSTEPLEFQEAINKAWEAAGTKGKRVTKLGAVSASKGMFEQSD
jgi:hypothetical protein